MASNKRVRGYRNLQRAAGLRLIQLWVPDTGAPSFAAECRRQCRLLRSDMAEAEVLEFIERAGVKFD